MRILNLFQEYAVTFVMALMLLMFGRIAWAQDKPAQAIILNYATTTLTTAAYVQLDSAMDASCASLDVSNTGNNPVYLAMGAASAESIIPFRIPAGTTGLIRIHTQIARGVRLSARSQTADMTAGFLIVNCLQ